MVLRELERRPARRTSSGSRTGDRLLRAVVGVDAGTVVFGGEIDISRSEDLATALATAELTAVDLTLDLRTATLLDSTAVNVITDAARRTRERGGRVTVLAPHRLVRRVLRMTFADELVDVRPPFVAADDRDGPTVLPL